MTTSVEVCGGPILIVAGRQLPALSVAWEASEYPDRWTGHTVFMGECRLDVDHDEWPEPQPICMQAEIGDPLLVPVRPRQPSFRMETKGQL
jgi:hypothetical protein